MKIGVVLAKRRDAEKGAVLRTWLNNQVIPACAGRILPIDPAIARKSAGLQVPDPHAIRDKLIAATALVHTMAVVTRNVVDFAGTGVALIKPWEPE